MATGQIKWFSFERGFGFIAPDMGPCDVFVHAAALHAAGLDDIRAGERIEFDLVQLRDGRLTAHNIRRG